MEFVFTEINESQLPVCDKPELIGVHHQADISLYKLADGDYVIVNPSFDPAQRAPCRGRIVDSKIRDVIEAAYQNPDLRVFYPGAAGPLTLNLPVVQTRAGEWIYYVAENQRDAFFAFDFKRARSTPDRKKG